MTFSQARILNEYPRGTHRRVLLMLTVLATMLVTYQFQLAPILSLLLPFLHLSKVGYGYFASFVVLIGGVSAFFGGPLADRYGRVVIINACLGAVTLLVFANLFIAGVLSFVVVRTTMGLVSGLMAGAVAALARDMSPRLNRALAFALLGLGAVGANYLANLIAGITLPIYHTWQSQIWIMGFVGIVMYIPIVLFLKDLSPEVRLRIYQSEVGSVQEEGHRLPLAAELPSSTREAFAALFKHLELWLLVLPFTVSLSLYAVIQGFGPLMFTEAFHYTPADAAKMCEYFWLGNMGTLIVVAQVSDRLQMRKPIMILGAILTSAVLMWWIPMFGGVLSQHTMTIVATVLGCLITMTTVPWSAQYSETLEEISPALQATGWAFYGLVARAWGVISVPLMLTIVVHYGWVTWIKFSLVALVIFSIAMCFTHPSAAEARTVSPKPQREAATA